MEEKLSQLTFLNAAIFGVLLAAAYFFLFYHPTDPKVMLDVLETERVEIDAAISKLDREIKAGQVIKKEIEVMEKFVETTYSQLSENVAISKINADISQEARAVGLSIEAIMSSDRWNKKKTVASVDVDASVSGTFSQIMIFLSELTRDNKVYSVFDLRVESERDKEDLKMNVKIQAYKKLTLEEIKEIEALDGDQ